MKKKFIFIFFLSCFIFSLGTLKVSAATMDFTISPQIPSNQANPDEGFFDLLMPNPGSEQNLQIVFKNISKKAITVEASIAPATTSSTGIVQYTETQGSLDPSLKYNIKDLVQFPSEINLLAGESKTISFRVKMPDVNFNGLIAGGLTFKEKASHQSTNSTKGIMLTNLYQYMISILMRQVHNKQMPQLTLSNVDASQNNTRNVIAVNLENSAPYFFCNLNVKADVTGLTNKTLSYHFKNSSMQMAPNSNFNLAIPVSIQGPLASNQYSKPLQAGNYKMTMTAYGQEDSSGVYSALDTSGQLQHYDYRWSFSKNFTITQAQANKLNRTDMSIQKVNDNWLIGLGAGVLLFILVVFFFLFILRKRRKKSNDEKRALQNKINDMQKELEKKNNN
ncbi:DUF916 and DUF3324 domain-containing protein [Lactococcus fujiensis]|nr:DUF916 and DUF3324 domain-containing protein [Lactococcus fujiensis]